jgi:hypothetical protein
MTTIDPSGPDTSGPPPSGFIYGMSDGSGGVSFECDLFAQDCNRGEKCMPWANDGGPDHNATRCSPLDANPGAPGDPCVVEGSGVSGIDNCELGAMCLDVDETGAGVCVAMCEGSAEAPICPDGKTCAQMNDGALSLCLDECDPLQPDCEGPKGCYPVNDSFACMTPVDDAGVAPGDVCAARGLSGGKYNSIRGCVPGMICIGDDAFTTCTGAGCCSPVCDTSDPASDDTCAAIDVAQTCEHWFFRGFAPPGYENAGVCALPL